MLKLIRGLSENGAAQTKKPVNPLKIARAVGSSFFGVRKGADLDADAASITPLQAIVGAICGAALIGFTLFGIVQLVVG